MAKALGVSTATISNAFNRPDQLSDSLRKRILQECKALGYSGPSLAARSLRSGKSDVIGVMLADSLTYTFSDPMAHTLLEGVSEVLEQHNKQLLLLSSRSNSSSQMGAESLPDGFIFYGTPNPTSMQRILNLNKPCVSVDFSYPDMPSVNIDNATAARELAEYAIHSEADTVAVIGMRLVDDQNVRSLEQSDTLAKSQEIAMQRLTGYLAGAKIKGVNIPLSNQVHIPLNRIVYAEQAAEMLLSQAVIPNVILCMSDVIAMTVCRVAAQKGIEIPSQLRVTGFDDIEEATRNVPTLTTCSQQGKEKGILAANMLLSSSTEKAIMPTKLHRRNSA